MKDKILAAIKAKFPKVNLSKARLDAIAAKIEKEVIDDETKIDAAIDDFNKYNPIDEIAKTDDKIRDLESKVKKPAPAKKEGDDNPNPPEQETTETPTDTPAWAKQLIEGNKTLAEKLAKLEGEKVANTIRGKAADQLKDIPESYWVKRALPEKEEDVETFVQDVKTDYEAFTKDLTDKGLSIPVPGSGSKSNPQDTTKKASKDEVDQVLNSII
jgi:hypothetical protein